MAKSMLDCADTIYHCRACGNGNVRQIATEPRDPTERPTRWRVFCKNCGATTDYMGSERAAIAAWNSGRIRMRVR